MSSPSFGAESELGTSVVPLQGSRDHHQTFAWVLNRRGCMADRSGLQQVGAMDPELRNSPVAQEFDEDSDTVRQLMPGEAVCYFNGRAFAHDEYVCSGSQVLRCRYGVWIEAGSADPDNP
jgi:hypothetical protein